MNGRKRPVAAKGKPRKVRSTAMSSVIPEWTEARFWGFIRSTLRAGTNRWPSKWKVLATAKRNSESTNKRLKYEYLCNHCGLYYPSANVSVDHIIPAGSLKSYDDLADFVRKLFVGEEGLQVLCDGCHQAKTNREKETSKEERNKQNGKQDRED